LGRRPGKEDGPHLVYVPEADFSEEKFLADVERVYTKLGRCLIAVSEGIHDANGAPIASVLAEKAGQAIEKDAHGNVQLSGTGALGDALATAVKDYFAAKDQKVRVRADTFGYLQRSFVGCASVVDQREARASSRAAAKAALDGAESGSIAIVRTSTPGAGENYAVDYKLVPVTEIAAKTKHLPTSYVTGDNNITEDFKHYALPLVGELPVIETL
ncbi:MAG: 6-phosphofructokinase, partial [Planctomycetota bacterium]